MKPTRTFLRRALNAVGSSRFFWALVVILVLQAAWIALTGRYPMAFDEDFHLGIIRLYAHHPYPFWAGQPDGGNAFGAVARDPSYMYHFLMSFPYRLVSLFTHNQTTQVLWLRGINIALFASCLPLYRRLLLRSGASRTIVHACLAVFVLIPMVPLLAAQINYDNLLLPVVAIILLTTLKWNDALQRKRIDGRLSALVVSFCLLASLIKYAFLPILLAVFGFMVVRLWQTFGDRDKLRKAVTVSFRTVGLRGRWLLAALLLLSIGLFTERYGINTVRYHNPVPDCGHVLSVEACSAYGPWIRDYNFSLNKVPGHTTHSPVAYMGEWLYGMWLRSFFAVDGPTTHFQTHGPLPVPAISAIVFVSAGLLAFIARGRVVLRKYQTPALGLMLAVSASYLAILWLDDYKAFLHTDEPVAINGRYLIPVLLPLLVVGALSIYEVLRKRPKLPPVFATIVILCLLWGGGALTYILRSNDAWYWRAQPVYDANHAVQRVFNPIVPGTNKPTMFLR